MGIKIRHFNALMRKNWIIWKRNPVSSGCQLVTPLFLMLFIVWIRTKFAAIPIDSTSLLQLRHPIYTINVTDQGAPNYLATSQHLEDFMVYSNYTDIFGVGYDVLYDFQSPVYFFPANCDLESSFTVPKVAAPIIAVVGQVNQVQQQTVNYLKMLLTEQQKAGTGAGLYFQFFDSQSDLNQYISSKSYLAPDPGVCFGFEIVENSKSDYQINMFFDDQKLFGGQSGIGIPFQNLPEWSASANIPKLKNYQQYSLNGYSLLQNVIANMVLRESTAVPSASISMVAVPIQSDSALQDRFSALWWLLGDMILFAYLIPMYTVVFYIVSEKETRTKESMRMMGLTDFPYWASWLCYYTIINTITALFSVAVLSINIINYSSKFYVFSFIWLFGEALFGEIIVIQSLFFKSKYAGIVASVIYMGLIFVNIPIMDQTDPKGLKWALSVIPQVNLYQTCEWLLLFEGEGFGVNRKNAGSELGNFNFNEALILYAIGFVLFLCLGLYMDAVMPSEYGSRQHPLFLCKPATYSCCRRRNINLAVRNLEGQEEELIADDDVMEFQNISPGNYEPVASEIARQELDGQFMRIQGLEKTYDNGFHAVQGLNLKMYKNQIFALLGQNGAGKSTTISMLTGLIQKTKGQAKVFDIDMFRQADQVRQFMGVCPQHDILFDCLTPEEHLSIFFDFKGGNVSMKMQEIKELIRDVGLEDDQNKQAQSLSGGAKRKLSVAIAMCGGSKLVLLDEPTAGMDLGARRSLWDMLKNYRRNKIIILTTHYMDEADVLGDRIGIMAHGKMKCLGSSLFLKNRFGAGYKLTLVKAGKGRNTKIWPYLEKELGQVELISEVSSEISFGVPAEASKKFKVFFEQFDRDLSALDITSYGISITTLEEVFLHINKELGVDLGNDVKESELEKKVDASGIEELIVTEKDPFVANRNSNNQFQGRANVNNSYQNTSNSSVRFSKLVTDHENLDSQIVPERLMSESSMWDNIKALLQKRFNIYKRDRSGLACEVLVPFLMVVVGCALTKINFNKGSLQRVLSPDLYPAPQRILMNYENVVNSGAGDVPPQVIFSNLPDAATSFQVNYSNQTEFSMFNEEVFAARLQQPEEPYRYGSYQIYRADNITQTYQINTFLNLTSQDVTALYPQFMYESVIKVATNNPSFNFQVTTVPFPNLYVLDQRAKTGNAFDFVFMVGIGMALIPCVMVSYILKERTECLKHMQLISGMSLPAYWISNMMADIVKVYIPVLLMLATSILFNANYPDVWVLFLLLPLALVPFSYMTSFLFGSDTSAQILTLGIHFFTCTIMAVLVFTLQAVPSTFALGDKLRWYCCIVPTYAVVNGMLWSSSGQQIIDIRQSNTNYPQLPTDNWAWKNIGGDVAVLIGHLIIDSLILAAVEGGVFGFLRKFSLKKVPPQTLGLQLDVDVQNEENRVISNTEEVVRVSKFRKAYTSMFGEPFLAVENISFGLDFGECFALLGVNGAGKSTTFKSLTAEIDPSAGEITIKGYNIQTQFSQARKLIGYCPQENAIFFLLTVEEHLYFYAKLKGIPSFKQKEVVDKAILELNLSEHAKKPAGTLSGGNKRKLAVAIATIGNPSIILLDEPSAGMDPEARRFMWSVVANISQRDKQSAVILTTHSMEEAEALSTKMGIMTRGGLFKCFGSAQHIKHRYGTGYEIEIKVKKPEPEAIKALGLSFGFKESLDQRIDLASALIKAKLGGLDQKIADQVKSSGLGSELALEAEQSDNTVLVRNLLVFFFIMNHGYLFIELVASHFLFVDLFEQCSDFFKFRIPRQDKSIGFLFGLIEENKSKLMISEYSVCQTSLEQIFQTFANQKISQKMSFKFKLSSTGKLEIADDNEDQRQLLKSESR